MHQSKYRSRLRQFHKEIRRQQIEKRRRQFRINAELDFTTLESLAEFMNLPKREQPTTIQSIISSCFSELKLPPINGNRIIEESRQDGLSIEAHCKFWKYYSEQLQQDKQLWSESIAEIIMSIIKDYTYEEVHYNTTYQMYLLNSMQLVCTEMTRSQKDLVLGWIAGAEGIRVIFSCIDHNFMTYYKYKRVYRVIELGLRSELKYESEEAARLLQQMMEPGDWDDSYSIYDKAQGLMIYLCTKVQKYYLEEETKCYSEAIMSLLDTYEGTVLDYARTGVAYTASLLVQSKRQQNVQEGMIILRCLSSKQNNKMVDLLLENRDVLSTNLWEKLLETKDVSRSRNTQIRRAFYSFISNLLAAGNQQQAERINNKFGKEYSDIYDLLSQCFRIQEEPDIIRQALTSLKCLVYYGQREKEQNALTPVLQAKDIIKHLQRLSSSQNQLVSEEAGILQNLLFSY